MKVNSQLERAQFENLASNPAAATVGRFLWNTVDGKAYLDDGTTYRSLLRNDGKAVFGNNGTAANNIRFHRGANGVLQLVSGADTTAEGTLSTALNQISAKQENYSTGTLPAVGNQGRVAFVTDTGFLNVDNGSAWKVLVDTNTAQTITGKTVTASSFTDPTITNAGIFTQIATPANPSAGFNKLYVKSDGKFYTLDSSGNEASVGSGSGGGGAKNLITNGSADDTAASIFVPYADTGTRPVDGVGGAPTVTTSVTSTTPLDGTKAFLLTKTAVNSQGQGWAIPFTVAPAYQAKSLKISADFIVNSGTFVPGTNIPSLTDGDLIWYIYDVTNSTLIEPSNIKMFSSSTTISDKFEATFQTSVAGTSYRLIAHVASTSALAFEIKLDNITVSPQVYVFGTPVTDCVTTTVTCNLTNQVTLAKKRRVGDSMEYSIQTKFSAAPGAATASWTLPDSIDPVKLAQGAISTVDARGICKIYDASSGIFYVGVVSVTTSNTVEITIHNTTAVSNTIPVALAVNDYIEFIFTVPIVGLSSSVQMSDQADTRVVAAIISNAGQTFSTGGSSKFTNLVAALDTHGAVSSTRYTSRVAGFYQIDQANGFGSVSATFRATEYYKNGGSVIRVAGFNGTASTGTNMPASYKVYLNVGDYLEFGAFQNTGANESVSAEISIARIAGPSAIAASEKVSFDYAHTSGSALSAGVHADAVYNVKIWDSHNIYNTSTGEFKLPRAGRARLTARALTNNATPGGISYMELRLLKNGSPYRIVSGLYNPNAGTTTYPIGSGTCGLEGLTTDVFKLQFYSGFNTNVIIAADQNFLNVEME